MDTRQAQKPAWAFFVPEVPEFELQRPDIPKSLMGIVQMYFRTYLTVAFGPFLPRNYCSHSFPMPIQHPATQYPASENFFYIFGGINVCIGDLTKVFTFLS